MLDKIQFLLSLQILGFCVFGGITLLLRARENRAKQILGWSMLLWAFLAAVRVSVNLYLEDSKEIFHPDVLIMGCIVVATLACYVIEVLRPCYTTVRRFFIFTSPIWVLGISFLIYRLSGGNIHRYNSFGEVFDTLNLDVVIRLLILFFTLLYMIVPIYLILRYSEGFKVYLRENVSDPEDYDLDWLKKTMLILSSMYIFYLVLLFTDRVSLYVIDKTFLLVLWYYFFYKALFLKVIHLDYTFDETRNSWFPHISPDGKQIVFITYTKGDLEPGQHLANKNVELRLMPAEGGEPKTLVKLFGGQGTINVNSWAPDSKRFAFVSYRLN